MRLVVFLLLLLPLAGAEGIQNPSGSHEVDLFLHLDGNQDIRMTPQPPPPEYTDTISGGLVGSGCVASPGQSLTAQQHHTWYAIVSPHPVRYDNDAVVGQSRGLHGDLYLSEGSMRLDWYVRSSVVGSDASAPAPQVSLRATLREGDAISVDNQALDRGRIIAQAETEPAVLAPGLDQGDTMDHGNDTYGFHVDLPVAAQVIPADVGFNLRIDVRVSNPACDDAGGYVTPPYLAAHTRDGLRPVLRLAHEQPVVIERMAVEVQGGAVMMEAEVSAPFGSADAILTRDHFRVVGPSPEVAVSDTTWWNAEPSDRMHPNAQANQAPYLVSAMWIDPAGEAVGEHTVQFSVASESAAMAHGALNITLGDATSCSVIRDAAPTCATITPSKDAPAPLPIVALLALLLLRRR